MDVAFLKSVALAFFLLSGPAMADEPLTPELEGELHDCVFAGVMKTGSPTRGDELSRSEVDALIEEDEAWRKHLRHFSDSPGRSSFEGEASRPLKLKCLSPVDGR